MATREMRMDAATVAHWEEVSGRPWEWEWAEYWGILVRVLHRFEHCALIRRPDGLSCVVETADLGEL